MNKRKSDTHLDKSNNSNTDNYEEKNGNGEDSSFQGKECAICQDVPESIIYLSCEHIICLVCAAKLIISDHEEKDIDFSEIECKLCGEKTTLSKEVQETLYDFLQNGEINFESDEELNEDQKIDETKSKEEKENPSEVNESKSSVSDKNHNLDPIVQENEEEENPIVSQGHNLNRENSKLTSNKVIQPQKKNINEGEDEKTESEHFSSNNGGFNFTLLCSNHVNEEYSYYNCELKKLYCTQCLLTEVSSQSEFYNIKPLKKCIPEILQNFQEILNDVEVQKSLIKNKKKDLKIRKENIKSQTLSAYKRYELEVDELIDLLQERKSLVSKEFESKGEKLCFGFDQREKILNENLGYLDSILTRVKKFKSSSDNPEEEIFEFFFKNQSDILKCLKDQMNNKESNENEHSEALVNELKSFQNEKMSATLNVLNEKISKNSHITKKIEQSNIQNYNQIFGKMNYNLKQHSNLKSSQQIQNSSIFDFIKDMEKTFIKSNPKDTFVNPTNPNYQLYKTRIASSLGPEKFKVGSQNQFDRYNLNLFEDKNLSKNVSFSGHLSNKNSKMSYNFDRKKELEDKLALFNLKRSNEEFLVSNVTNNSSSKLKHTLNVSSNKVYPSLSGLKNFENIVKKKLY